MKNREKATGVIFVCLIAAFTLVLASCATEMSTRASRVRLVSVDHINECEVQCEFLGNVQGESYQSGWLFWSYTARRIAYNNALNELLDNAAELGATHVYVNLGDYPDLRGEAYSCCYCRTPDGKPDEDYCRFADGKRDAACCRDRDGKVIGAAHCECAEGKDPVECKANGGKWIPAIDKKECEKRSGKWIPEAKDRKACEDKGGIWLPVAKDQVTCESIKGGKWIINEDVLRRLPAGYFIEEGEQ
jgi:hypothetical protein